MTLPFLISYGLAIVGFALILGIPQTGDIIILNMCKLAVNRFIILPVLLP